MHKIKQLLDHLIMSLKNKNTVLQSYSRMQQNIKYFYTSKLNTVVPQNTNLIRSETAFER